MLKSEPGWRRTRRTERDREMGNESMTPKRAAALLAALAGLSLLLSACGNSGDTVSMDAGNGQPETGDGAPGSGDGSPDPVDGAPGDGGPPGPSIAWGPRLPSSDLSPIVGARDDFGADIPAAIARAAEAVPMGASQSSRVEDGRTADEMSVRVVRDEDGILVHEVTDGAQFVVQVPGPLPRQEASLALFTDLIPGIEPDLSSYPHEVLGVWAWGGHAGAFWSRSPPAPPVQFGPMSPTGRATYEGDAVGLRAADGAAAKFLADVEMVADFGSRTVGGTVDGFRTLSGKALAAPAVTLDRTKFSASGDAFSGETVVAGVAGGGKWGGRWSDGRGEAMGGTFGFAATDGSVSLLGAFTACHCASASDGDPDDPVASRR